MSESVPAAVLQFCVASVTMMAGNKQAVAALPLPCTLVIIQAVGTLVLLQLPYCRRQRKHGVSVEMALAWCPVALIFTAMLFTSLKSFVYAGVSTVLIFRNVGAILTSIVEYFVRGETITFNIACAEVLIVAGAVLYGKGSLDYTPQGLFWILLNVCAQVAYGVLLKSKMDTDERVRGLSKFSMSLYNNMLAIPMTAVALVAQGEHAVVEAKLLAVTPTGWLMIGLTCFFGFLISTSGFGLQRLVNATTFIVINNLTKFFNILLGMLVMNDRITGAMDAGGCVLALAAGCWYSYELTRKPAAKKAQVAR